MTSHLYEAPASILWAFARSDPLWRTVRLRLNKRKHRRNKLVKSSKERFVSCTTPDVRMEIVVCIELISGNAVDQTVQLLEAEDRLGS